MTTNLQILTVEKVKEGDQLPSLAVDVSATTVVLGALAARDWRPMHHDKDFAVNRNGVKDPPAVCVQHPVEIGCMGQECRRQH